MKCSIPFPSASGKCGNESKLISFFASPIQYTVHHFITLFPETSRLTDELEPQEEFSASS